MNDQFLCCQVEVRVFTLSHARSFYTLTSKVPPLGLMLILTPTSPMWKPLDATPSDARRPLTNRTLAPCSSSPTAPWPPVPPRPAPTPPHPAPLSRPTPPCSPDDPHLVPRPAPRCSPRPALPCSPVPPRPAHLTSRSIGSIRRVQLITETRSPRPNRTTQSMAAN